MLNLDPRKIKDALQEQHREIEGATAELQDIEEQYRSLSSKEREAQQKILRARNTERQLRAALLACGEAIDELADVLDMRSRILKALKRVERKDILVSTREATYEELRELKESIKTICPHPFVMNRDGYAGSRIDDYDDAYSPERVCVVCAFVEKGVGQRRGDHSNYPGRFTKLAEGENRVVVERPYKMGSIWVPLEDILKEHFLPKST